MLIDDRIYPRLPPPNRYVVLVGTAFTNPGIANLPYAAVILGTDLSKPFFVSLDVFNGAGATDELLIGFVTGPLGGAPFDITTIDPSVPGVAQKSVWTRVIVPVGGVTPVITSFAFPAALTYSLDGMIFAQDVPPGNITQTTAGIITPSEPVILSATIENQPTNSALNVQIGLWLPNLNLSAAQQLYFFAVTESLTSTMKIAATTLSLGRPLSSAGVTRGTPNFS
jgi:hypothetical protein